MSNTNLAVESEIERVEESTDPGWVEVTLRSKDGENRVITVRRGSSFAGRPSLAQPA